MWAGPCVTSTSVAELADCKLLTGPVAHGKLVAMSIVAKVNHNETKKNIFTVIELSFSEQKGTRVVHCKCFSLHRNLVFLPTNNQERENSRCSSLAQPPYTCYVQTMSPTPKFSSPTPLKKSKVHCFKNDRLTPKCR